MTLKIKNTSVARYYQYILGDHKFIDNPRANSYYGPR